jgi:hypothetical protein
VCGQFFCKINVFKKFINKTFHFAYKLFSSTVYQNFPPFFKGVVMIYINYLCMLQRQKTFYFRVSCQVAFTHCVGIKAGSKEFVTSHTNILFLIQCWSLHCRLHTKIKALSFSAWWYCILRQSICVMFYSRTNASQIQTAFFKSYYGGTRTDKQKYMISHKITEFCTEWFSVCPNITWKFRNMTEFKTSSKKIMIEIELVSMSMTFTLQIYMYLCSMVHELSS